MIIKPDETLASIVCRNINAAGVLNQYGINYFSKGDRNLEAACLEDGGPMTLILEELWELKGSTLDDFQRMSLIQLSTYILKTHHRFTEKKLTFIKHTLSRLVVEHGSENERIRHLQKAFIELCVYLTVHMRHEELIVFPFIQKLASSGSDNQSLPGQIFQPIESMKDDHAHEVNKLKHISILTKNYSTSKDSDYALRITYDAMRELENDLKIHMHLENNILFPRAIKLADAYLNSLN